MQMRKPAQGLLDKLTLGKDWPGLINCQSVNPQSSVMGPGDAPQSEQRLWHLTRDTFRYH